MVKRIIFVLIAVVLFITPCFAIDNTLGVVEEKLLFYGFSVDELGHAPQYGSPNGFSVPKELSSRDNLNIDGSYIYFYFAWPTLADELTFEGVLSLSTTVKWLQGTDSKDIKFYGGVRDSYNNCSFTDLGTSYAYLVSGDDGNVTFRFTKPVTLVNDSYYYLVLGMRTYDGNRGCELIRSLTYSFTDSFSGSYDGETSSSGTYSGSTSGKLSPSASTQKVNSTLDMSDVSSSGTIDLGEVDSSYLAVTKYNAESYGLFKFVELYDGSGTYLSFVDKDNLRKSLPNITSESQLSGSATFAGTTSTVSYSGTRSSSGSLSTSGDDSGALSGSGSGTLLASTTSDVMAYAQLTATYGDDGGLVDEVFRQGDVMDDMAADLQQMIDDMNDKTDTASDIGSVTSDQTIKNTQETLSSGTESLNSGLEIAGDVASISAPASMMVGLMAATVTPLLNFGNGVLYWALFSMLIGSVILFVLRRLSS